MARFKLPIYRPTKYSKRWVYTKMGKACNTISLLGVDERTFRNWGQFIPSPYADRLFLSDWGKNKVEPRFVSIEDALIIFKDFRLMANHFGKKKFWKQEDMVYLPELESAYMIRHFGKFMRIYTSNELNKVNYL